MPTSSTIAASMNPGRVGTGAADDEAGEQGRHYTSNVAGKVLEPGPQAYILVRGATLQDHQKVAGCQPDQRPAGDQCYGGVGTIYPGRGNQK